MKTLPVRPVGGVSWLAVLSFLARSCWAADPNPRDNFCRRFAQQTTVIDDKLYIDGGYLNYNYQTDQRNHPNTYLGYHDLNRLVKRGREYWPDLNISLSKNDTIPSVAGGVLWGDNVNKKFYLYGGEWTDNAPQDNYRIFGYDILNNKWDDYGPPVISPQPEVAAFGAGVGVSETGMGYYYGGWVSNRSMNNWNGPPKMSSKFYTYSYDNQEFLLGSVPDNKTRAEGAMVWIPAGDTSGLLVYMGGLVGSSDKGPPEPQPLSEVMVYDAASSTWYFQKTTGIIPQNRRQFCIDVAWAPDKSSFNIYLWGGHSATPPAVDVNSFADVYILTLPSFTWVKAYPDHNKNTSRADQGHYASSCNMVKNMSQFFVIGGVYTDNNNCDAADFAWGQHNFWTGTKNNAGDSTVYWSLPNASVTNNVVPNDVYNVVGGDKYGHAKVLSPKGGFSADNKGLKDLMSRRPPTSERTPTRHIPSATSSPSPTPKERSGPSTGAIVGIAFGAAAALGLVLLVWFLIGRKVARHQEARRQSGMSRFSFRNGNGKVQEPSVVSPQMSMGTWVSGTAPAPPSPEHLTPHDGSFGTISELPTQHEANELHH